MTSLPRCTQTTGHPTYRQCHLDDRHEERCCFGPRSVSDDPPEVTIFRNTFDPNTHDFGLYGDKRRCFICGSVEGEPHLERMHK